MPENKNGLATLHRYLMDAGFGLDELEDVVGKVIEILHTYKRWEGYIRDAKGIPPDVRVALDHKTELVLPLRETN